MKKIIPSLFAVAAITVAAATGAAETVKLTGVHLCCKSCVKGVEKALSKSKGVTSEIDAKAGSVTLNGAEADLKKALAAISRGGFSGQSEGKLKVPTAKAETGKVKAATFVGVHLCCGKCVKGVQKALSTVEGVTGDTVKNKATSFDVTGDFEPQAVLDALAQAGFGARVGK